MQKVSWSLQIPKSWNSCPAGEVAIISYLRTTNGLRLSSQKQFITVPRGVVSAPWTLSFGTNSNLCLFPSWSRSLSSKKFGLATEWLFLDPSRDVSWMTSCVLAASVTLPVWDAHDRDLLCKCLLRSTGNAFSAFRLHSMTWRRNSSLDKTRGEHCPFYSEVIEWKGSIHTQEGGCTYLRLILILCTFLLTYYIPRVNDKYWIPYWEIKCSNIRALLDP